jgi:hypothetical protein
VMSKLSMHIMKCPNCGANIEEGEEEDEDD